MSRASSTATRCTAATCTVRQNARRHALRSSMFLPRSRTAPTAVSVIFGKTSPTSPSTMIQGDGASRRPTWSQIPSCAVDLSRRSRADGAQPTSGLHSPDKLPPMLLRHHDEHPGQPSRSIRVHGTPPQRPTNTRHTPKSPSPKPPAPGQIIELIAVSIEVRRPPRNAPIQPTPTIPKGLQRR